MRLIHFLATILAAGPLAVSAAGTLGWALGDKNPDGTCKALSDWQADLAVLKGKGGSLVRVYSSDECDTAKNLIPAAKNATFKVLLGIWLESPDTDMTADEAALQASIPGNEETVFGITVGSERLYNKVFTATQLLGKIQEVQNLFPQVLVGTADTWNVIADGTADPILQGGVKLILANAFSYWQGQDIRNATATYFDDMMQAIGHVQQVTGSLDAVHVMTGETGWPTEGAGDYEAAVAGTNNAMTYWKSGACGMLDWGVDLFWFSAFDDPTKAPAVGQDGTVRDETHWGAFTADRQPKFDTGC